MKAGLNVPDKKQNSHNNLDTFSSVVNLSQYPEDSHYIPQKHLPQLILQIVAKGIILLQN